ncbi:NACHT domain-containing protein [Rhodococcus pyridinivorans]|uniref:NACHT domain-containing protein n=1 Tax=Rhodococcus pyridinivorans TaxID=103816 RepID=UPI002284F95E|nr:NACHT domain-containing protein [Rhodococcus pyridinivorans]WAL49793.1 NACHT domain-containing protein [Rhodococcus pyridinivorans]
MIEPTVVATAVGASNATVGLGKSAAGGLSAIRRRFRLLGTFDPELFVLNAEEASTTDADVIGLSVTDVRDVERFLSSPQMEPVLAIFAVAKLAHPDDLRELALTKYRELFENEAQKWVVESGCGWRSKTSAIIDRIDALYNGTLSGVSSAVEAGEIEEFLEFVHAPALSGSTTTSYLDRIVSIATDVTRLAEVIKASTRVAEAIGAIDYLPIASHTDIDEPSKFLDLYVERNFVDSDDGLPLAQGSLSPSTNPFRHVLMGNPGAGKTTFVQHFKKTVSSSTDIPIVEIVCRTYAKSAWDKSLTQHIVDHIANEHAIRLTIDDVETMLLLGRMCVVFDGLDEVTDQSKRMTLVSRINSIACQYPMCSILVTTRILGYNRARLPSRLFSHIRLDEFDDQQVAEYCRRWFDSRQRPDLVASFESESESVDDLRKNPLMLSLLCALYREHGAIPTDRRGVYHNCADLLFRRWDNHRQIEHHEAMPKSADRLMQEIANFVYKHSSLQDGIQETQLVKVLAHSLVDRDGYEMSDAENDAQSFVNFCAGRAWLLASFGSDSRGQRMFRFTHRTFQEYFTAEDIARRAKTDNELVDEISAAFTKDETSVLPELLLQSYHYHRVDGAARVFKELVRTEAPSRLLLRLMEGVGLPRQHRTNAFRSFLTEWHANGITETEFNLLLAINPQARAQFEQEYLAVDSTIGDDNDRVLLLDAWCGRALSGIGGHHVDVWKPLMTTVAQNMASRRVQMDEPAVANWLIALKISPQRAWFGWEALACPSVYGAVPGVLWWTIDQRMGQGQDLEPNTVRDEAVRSAHVAIKNGAKVPHPMLSEFRAYIYLNNADFHEWRPATNHGSHRLDHYLNELAIYAVCALHEGGEETDILLGKLESFYRGSIQDAFALRDKRINSGVEPTREEHTRGREFVSHAPRWLKPWFDGHMTVVLYEDQPRHTLPETGLIL